MNNEYYLGLDMGTGSVGWAVTDMQYNLKRAHGKDLWGVRLFETAKTASERRTFRCNRRRLDRRNQRIQLLQEIFSEEITKIDPGFFLRLKESRYTPEDKRDITGNTPVLPYMLFVDENYTDKDFYREYPTIYHLRKELMLSDEAKDIRLVYLALHHIIKHRGHFLFPGIDAGKVTDFTSVFSAFVESINNEELEINEAFFDGKADYVKNIIQDEKMTKSSKASKLCKELKAETKAEKAILKLLTGCKVKLSEIFNEQELDNNEKPQVCFSSSSYDDDSLIIEEELAERYYIIAAARAIYDWGVLVNILGNRRTLSEAKVDIYEKHKSDLKMLKSLVKENLSSEEYKKVFVYTQDKVSNYPAYIGMTKINGKKVPLAGKQCTQEDFYSFIKKEVCAKIQDNENVQQILEDIELGRFMPRQVSKDNGVIPYQLQLVELKQILEKVAKYVPCVKENTEKIEQILSFRIPYYVGPIGTACAETNSFSWAVRKDGKENEKIYPWNFEDVIDVEVSAEKFIRRMTNKCSYLRHEDVLPKDSLLYAKFMVLNELNNLRLNGEKISVELKQSIYQNLFMRYRKVTQRRVRDYLLKEGIIEQETEITGVDGDFKASLKAYHDFKEKLTDVNLSEKESEDIILNITLFGADKNLLKKRISKLFPQFTTKQIKGICSLTYKDWGRLSKCFLTEICDVNKETGEYLSILGMLWETNDNLMQLLSKNYNFAEEIEKRNAEEQTGALTYKTVEEMYVSPPVKRQIWQTLQIVNEIKKVMGEEPKRVFLEVAREKQDTGRTQSRKKKLYDLYAKCEAEERNWTKEIDARNEHDFKSNRLFLYYTQKGRCMYCGKTIDLEELWDKNTYDIDHIYPQSKVMDDSINNRVLTCRICNAKKTDNYPLSGEIRQKMKPFWTGLVKSNFIEKEKYKRLTRGEEFSPNELAGFIERQLVETRQSTKAVAEILKKAMPDTEIVYAKAKPVSEFRKQFDFVKVREINDLHHAQDAYLNIVVGNTYHVKFTHGAAKFIEKNPYRSYNLKRMFISEKDVISGDEIAWKSGEGGTIATVRRTMKKNSALFTRKSYTVQGGLFDQMPMKKGKGQIPLKSSDERLCNIEKYGGYNKATGAYFVLVESEGKKGIKKRTLEFVPLHIKSELEKSEEKMRIYLEEKCELKNPKVLISKIKTDSLFEVDGFRMHLSGRTEKRLLFKGANQLYLGQDEQRILKKIVKVTEALKQNKNYFINEYDKISEADLEKMYDVLLSKIESPLYSSRLSSQISVLKNGRERFDELSLENKCKTLFEMLHLFRCQSGSADLTSIGGASKAGIIKIGNNITEITEIYIINQSSTGIFEQKIDLKTI